jgi:hypothetical protein
LYRFLTPELGASRTNKNQKKSRRHPGGSLLLHVGRNSEAYCAEQAAEYARASPRHNLHLLSE